MYSEITYGIQVEAFPLYIMERSNPELEFYFFAYQIKIKNLSEKKVQLQSRHWIIKDGTGQVEHFQGLGVVGKQPHLAPGEEFEYTSFCPLRTPTGNMRGTYSFVDDQETPFDVKVPLFFLRSTVNPSVHPPVYLT